ncbi:MAG: hypothetical protein ACPKPY_11385 [Nitrososphaeraceae archaeon]
MSKEKEKEEIKEEFEDADSIERLKKEYTSATTKEDQVIVLDKLAKNKDKGIETIRQLVTATIDTDVRKYGFNLIKQMKEEE